MRREVEIDGRDARLLGTLTSPETTGPAPGVVFLHGSGPATRDAWSGEVEILAGRTIASLAYDKPADWTSQSFADRAEEALHAVRFLQAQPEVDERGVGLFGGSQGAWIAPMAAAASYDVAFVVAVSASGIGPREQDRYRVEHHMRADGFDEDQIAGALAAWREGDLGMRRGNSPETIAAAAERHRDQPWFEYLWFDEPDVIAFGQRIWDFDVVPYLERCRCPLFAAWGEADPIVPAEKSRRIFDRALRRAGNTSFEFVVVPGAGHSLRGGETERDDVTRLIADWILRAASR